MKNTVILMHQLPGRLQNATYQNKTHCKATPEQRVRGLLAFPFSAPIRAHTIQELLNDPETADITRRFLKYGNHE